MDKYTYNTYIYKLDYTCNKNNITKEFNNILSLMKFLEPQLEKDIKEQYEWDKNLEKKLETSSYILNTWIVWNNLESSFAIYNSGVTELTEQKRRLYETNTLYETINVEGLFIEISKRIDKTITEKIK